MHHAFMIGIVLFAVHLTTGWSRKTSAPPPRSETRETGRTSALSSAAAPLPPPVWSDQMEAVAGGADRFACELYGRLRTASGNLFFSPASIHTSLSMTATGARGATRAQMAAVLHLPAAAAAGRVPGRPAIRVSHP